MTPAQIIEQKETDAQFLHRASKEITAMLPMKMYPTLRRLYDLAQKGIERKP